MRLRHDETVLQKMTHRRPWLLVCNALLCVGTLIGVASVLIIEAPASAAVTVTVAAQSPIPVLASGTATYNPITFSGGGGTPDYVKLTGASGLPTGATFADTDGCVAESGGAGAGTTPSFTGASVATSGAALGTYSFTITATEYTSSANCSSNTSGTAYVSPSVSLQVGYKPTLTATGPSSDTAGTSILASALSSTIASGDTSPAVSGTISFSIFGPVATAPTVCTSGGTTLGTATVTANGTYTSSLGFTPVTVGDYWLYASYNGDTYDQSATSTCGVGMSETVVGPAASVVSWVTPSSITYGTALSATQLDATSGTGGTFAYSPALGAVPAVGTDTLSVVFTPYDTTDYAAASGSVSIVVNPAPLQITASSTTVGYGVAPPAVSATYSGFVNGDSASSLSTQPSCKSTETSTTAHGVDAGANTCSGAVDANYTISYVAGSVTVNAPVIKFSTTSLRISSGKKTTVGISCTVGTCAGTVDLSYRSKTAVLGTATFSIAAGASGTVTINLNRTGRHKLGGASKKHSFRSVLRATVTDGTTITSTQKVT